MSILKAYSRGLSRSIRSLKMISVVYGVVLFTGLLFLFPFLSALREASGLTMAVEKMMQGFDYTVYSELLRFHGEGLKTMMMVAFWLVLFFVVVSVFLAGGILGRLVDREKRFSLSSFFADCGRWFFRFLRWGFYYVILQGLVAAAVFVPAGFLLAKRFKAGVPEDHLFHTALWFGILYLILSFWFVIIGDYTRIGLVAGDSKKVFREFRMAVKFVVRHFFATYGLYLLLLVVPVLTMFLFMKFIGSSDPATAGAVVLLFFLQQLYIWLRGGFRIWVLASQTEYYLERQK